MVPIENQERPNIKSVYTCSNCEKDVYKRQVGHIVGCRECCAHAIGVSGDIAAVDRAAVRIQGYGIGRGCPLHRQFRHISRNVDAGRVELPVAPEPHEVAACISVRAGQTLSLIHIFYILAIYL